MLLRILVLIAGLLLLAHFLVKLLVLKQEVYSEPVSALIDLFSTVVAVVLISALPAILLALIPFRRLPYRYKLRHTLLVMIIVFLLVTLWGDLYARFSDNDTFKPVKVEKL